MAHLGERGDDDVRDVLRIDEGLAVHAQCELTLRTPSTKKLSLKFCANQLARTIVVSGATDRTDPHIMSAVHEASYDAASCLAGPAEHRCRLGRCAAVARSRVHRCHASE